jgi:hypothetical protein
VHSIFISKKIKNKLMNFITTNWTKLITSSTGTKLYQSIDPIDSIIRNILSILFAFLLDAEEGSYLKIFIKFILFLSVIPIIKSGYLIYKIWKEPENETKTQI